MLERCVQLLRPGGRLAIVLPDTYLFSDSYGWLVQRLGQFTVRHSINVPIEAFEPHRRAKTSVVILRKEAPEPRHEIIGSVCDTFGEDKHGHPRYTFSGDQQMSERDDEMAEAGALLRPASATGESKLKFSFSQDLAVRRGNLVASYWWRSPVLAALRDFAAARDCDLVSVEELIDAGELQVFEGHGSPNSHFKGRGTIPYFKVVDIKNWRINENPGYFIPVDVATRYRKTKILHPFDLVTPTRASKNIGLFAVVMPWQTNVILTREIFVWRVRPALDA